MKSHVTWRSESLLRDLWIYNHVGFLWFHCESVELCSRCLLVIYPCKCLNLKGPGRLFFVLWLWSWVWVVGFRPELQSWMTSFDCDLSLTFIKSWIWSVLGTESHEALIFDSKKTPDNAVTLQNRLDSLWLTARRVL